MQTNTAVRNRGETPLDLLRVPCVGRFLRWRYWRRTLQGLMLAGAALLVVHGLVGPQLAPKNLATLLGWVHYRGLLVLVLLVAGNFFCMACPFMLPRDLARRFFRPRFHWPRRLRNKWTGIVLFVAVLYAYELLDLWGDPWATAWLILLYFAAILAVDGFFKNASFCKYVCPIGQFNFAASTVSPFEVAVRDQDTCARCTTVDCIKGTRRPDDAAIVLQRGCDLALFQPDKVGNMDCTFCLDCVHACPHDNVGITARLPGGELWDDRRRAGVGRLSARPDLSALALVFTFGALLNAFGMASPVYAVQRWLAGLMGVEAEAPVLAVLFAVLFAVVLVAEPALLLGTAALLTRRLTGVTDRVVAIGVRYAYALVPLGVGVWAAHYGFHLLTGLWTFVPVVARMATAFGAPALDPTLIPPGLSPGLVYPIELGLLGLGLAGSMLIAHQISIRDFPDRPRAAFAPWAGLCLLLAAAAVWLLSQPMEMRGTFLGS